MTIAELKESIEKMRIKEPDELGKAYNNALDFCLEMIDVYDKFREDEQALSQEPCDDAISRDAVIKILEKYNLEMSKIAEDVSELPPVTPQPKTGHWIEHPEIETSTPEYLMFYECSECGDRQCFCKSDIHKKHFCNNCGAKMVKPQESEEV